MSAKRKVWNDRGIRRAARDLSVSHCHLSLVLRGIRQSRRLTARYSEWKRTKKA